MTDNPIAAALRERMATPENDRSPLVKPAELDYVASRISLGGEYVRTESTDDGRNAFAIMATPEDVKSYNDMFGEHVRAGIYIGDDNQVTFCDNPLQAGLAYGSLIGRGAQVEVEVVDVAGPCDCDDCRHTPPREFTDTEGDD
jgi:hypothetical protein